MEGRVSGRYDQEMTSSTTIIEVGRWVRMETVMEEEEEEEG